MSFVDPLERRPERVSRDGRHQVKSGVLQRRRAVWIQTLALAFTGVALAWGLHAGVVSGYIASPVLSLVAAFTLVQALAFGLLLAYLVIARVAGQARVRRTQHVRSLIRQRIAAHSAGVDLSAELRRFGRKNAPELELCIEELLPSIVGSARARLSALVGTLGLVDRWTRQAAARRPEIRRRAIARLGLLTEALPFDTLQAALADSSDAVRIEASRGLLRTRDARAVEAVFNFAVTGSLLERAILANDLREHALVLARQTLPRTLGSNDVSEVLGALELICAWQVVVPLDGFGALLGHSDGDVRRAALRALPHVANAHESHDGVVSILAGHDDDTKSWAARAAGALKIEAAVAPLLACLRESRRDVALAAAHSLATIGPQGLHELESQISTANRPAAAAALEALERAKTGRAHAVSLQWTR